jgi:hypothetical protein
MNLFPTKEQLFKKQWPKLTMDYKLSNTINIFANFNCLIVLHWVL